MIASQLYTAGKLSELSSKVCLSRRQMTLVRKAQRVNNTATERRGALEGDDRILTERMSTQKPVSVCYL